MRISLSCALVLFASAAIAFGASPQVKVSVALSKAAVFAGENVGATVHLTNAGATDLELASSDYSKFKEQWVIDNPQVLYSGGVSIISLNGVVPVNTVKPGEDHVEQVSLNVPRAKDPSGQVVFRMGFKAAPDAEPVWSEPATLLIKPDEPFPVKIAVTMHSAEVKSWEVGKVLVKVSNPSPQPQYIGTEICGIPGVINWTVDNKALVRLQCGSAGCLHNMSPSVDVVLKPDESYVEKCSVGFNKESVKTGPVTFRMGLRTTGHVMAWSDDITVNVAGGSSEQLAQWQKTAAYQKAFQEQENVTSAPDGVVKRYYEDGVLRDERTVRNGKLDGLTKYYAPNGKLIKEVGYKAGAAQYFVDYTPNGPFRFDLVTDGMTTPQEPPHLVAASKVQAAADVPAISGREVIMNVTGVVDSFVDNDGASGVKAQLVVVDLQGEKYFFSLSRDLLVEADGQRIEPKALTHGQMVAVRYFQDPEGHTRAFLVRKMQ